MLLRFDPFRELDRLTEQLAAPATAPHIAMDAVKRGDTVEIRFDLPGFDPGSVDLEVDRNVLTLTAERHWEPGEGDEVIANERRYGRFTRQLLLGDQLDGGAVQAEFRDGVLQVTIPVAESAKPRKVAIGGASSTATIDVSESDDRRELTESRS
jgi:HSP20 family protein